MKRKIFISATSILLLLAVAFGVYFMSGCQKDVEEIPINNSVTYLTDIDLTGYYSFCDLISQANDNQNIPLDLDTLIDAFYTIATPELLDFLEGFDSQAIRDEMLANYSLSDEEIKKMNEGDETTINAVYQRFSTFPENELFSNEYFLDFLETIYSNPIFLKYLPVVDNINFKDILNYSLSCEPECLYPLNLKSTTSDLSACLKTARIKYNQCLADANLTFAKTYAEMTALYATCMAGAAILIWPPAIIAAAALCSAAYIAIEILVTQKYVADRAVCFDTYENDVRACHKGGS